MGLSERNEDRYAAGIWTFDGAAYRAIAAEGRCNATARALSVQGAPVDARGVRNDACRFEVDRASLAVSGGQHVLGAYPSDLNDRLDALARAGVPSGRLAGLAFDKRQVDAASGSRAVLADHDDGRLLHPKTVNVLVDARVGAVVVVEDVPT